MNKGKTKQAVLSKFFAIKNKQEKSKKSADQVLMFDMFIRQK